MLAARLPDFEGKWVLGRLEVIAAEPEMEMIGRKGEFNGLSSLAFVYLDWG